MSNRRVESFLLRVVVQDGAFEGPESWRGRIQHVGSGDERHFQHIEDVIAFIREQFSGDFARLTVDIDETPPR
ncbi:MAG: hypothetical protein RLZZ387_1689 [Chloroflexota bacterium]